MASAVSGCWPSSVQRTLLKWQTHAEYTTSHTRLNSLIVAKQGQTEDHKHMITYNSSTTTITLSTCTHGFSSAHKRRVDQTGSLLCP